MARRITKPLKTLSYAGRFVRLLISVIDPRAWLHLLRLVNYYNYSHVQPRRRMRIESSPEVSPNASFAHPERIEIGDDVLLGARTTLWAGPHCGRIVVGNGVMCGPDVFVTAANYQFDQGCPIRTQPMAEADVIIGEHVWIGARAIILPGARIGDGAVIGAGAVVTGEIPPMSVATGVPARVVRRRGRPDAEQLRF